MARGWVDVDGWSHTEINVPRREMNPDTVIHPNTNRTRRRLTLLIETNALPLRQSTTSSKRTRSDSTCGRSACASASCCCAGWRRLTCCYAPTWRKLWLIDWFSAIRHCHELYHRLSIITGHPESDFTASYIRTTLWYILPMKTPLEMAMCCSSDGLAVDQKIAQ